MKKEKTVFFTLEELVRGKVNFAYPEHWFFDRWVSPLDDNYKGDREIYQNDIIEVLTKNDFGSLQPVRNLVIWCEHNLNWALRPNLKKDAHYFFNLGNSMKVLGNIHDNLELMQ